MMSGLPLSWFPRAAMGVMLRGLIATARLGGLMLLHFALLPLFILMLSDARAGEGKRFALLVGNSAYHQEVGPLTNPGNDVKIVGNALRRLGFNVQLVENATLGMLYTALSVHTRRVRRAGAGAISFFYYSGHGAQDVDTRTNYLIPVDVRSSLDSDLWDRSLQLSILTRQLKQRAQNAVHFVVFDACRNDLKVRKVGVKAAVSTKGFVPIRKVAGMLVAYATAEGETASDVGVGAGPYARALAEELVKPGVEAVSMFRNVQVRIYEQMRQEPWLDFGYLSPTYLAGRRSVGDRQQNEPKSPLSQAAEAWSVTQNTTSISVLKAFERRFQGSVFSSLARARITELEAKGTEVASSAIPSFAAQVSSAPACDGVAFQHGSRQLVCVKPGSGRLFRDCKNCPAMTVLPAGRFQMGSRNVKRVEEHPMHQVKIDQSIAVGAYEVTRSEWSVCVFDGKCKPVRSGMMGGAKRNEGSGWFPVTGLSWKEAQTYVAWLSHHTGYTYRLLSEAEWEYAARAGTTTRYAFGETLSKQMAQISIAGPGSAGQPVPIGSFERNPWGLYDMHGNVWEWTEDCWNANYNGAPKDGSSALTGDCSKRVLRGGSWFNDLESARSARRGNIDENKGSDLIGLRVARLIKVVRRSKPQNREQSTKN
ncbi:MAG: SUMF1/EgtB/PvdO family nonheme iron enzyme [Hyphomicrobiaceae bacterium]